MNTPNTPYYSPTSDSATFVKGVFLPDTNGFLKQVDPQPFQYTEDYKAHQSTNPSMAWLRLGWLMAQIPFERLQSMSAVDIGSGNGTFIREAQKVFKKAVPYDLVGESISEYELNSTHWDVVCLSDVLEHFKSIDDFWRLSFQYALISYPEDPRDGVALEHWRHYKPDEHLYILNSTAFRLWVEGHGCEVVAEGHPEDAIRTRWHKDYVNISTFLIRRP